MKFRPLKWADCKYRKTSSRLKIPEPQLLSQLVELFTLVSAATTSMKETNWEELETLAELDTLFDLGLKKETLTLCCVSTSQHEKVFYLIDDVLLDPPCNVRIPNGLQLECDWRGKFEHVNYDNVFMIGLTRYPLTDQIGGKFGIELHFYEADKPAASILPTIKKRLEEKSNDSKNSRIVGDKV